MTNFVNDLFNLSGRNAIVVGGGGHLCGEMARGLAKAGVNVAVVDWSEEKAQAMVDEIATIAPDVDAFPASFDAIDKDAHAALRDQVVNRWGSLDILINGAGVNAPTPVMDIPADEFRKIVDSHLLATLIGCQVHGEQMLKQGKGAIINMSSASSGPPLSKAFTYSAAKAGVMNLTQNIAREWATKGVRVNGLRPGFFPTQWSLDNFIDEDRNAQILGHTPMGRYGQPSELVGAVIWLCSDAAGFVTGAEIPVDGGFTAQTI